MYILFFSCFCSLCLFCSLLFTGFSFFVFQLVCYFTRSLSHYKKYVNISGLCPRPVFSQVMSDIIFNNSFFFLVMLIHLFFALFFLKSNTPSLPVGCLRFPVAVRYSLTRASWFIHSKNQFALVGFRGGGSRGDVCMSLEQRE